MSWKDRLLKKKEEQPKTESIVEKKEEPVVVQETKEEPIDEIETALLQGMFRNDEDVRIFLAAERGRIKYNIAVKTNLEK